MRMSRCFGTLYKYELKKIIGNKVALITFLILFAFVFMQGEFEIRGNVEPAVLQQYKTLGGREIDDRLIGELLAVSDEYGRIADETDIAYEDLAGWVQNVIGYGVAYKDVDAAGVYEARDLTIEEAHEISKLSDGEEAFWTEKESKVVKPFSYNQSLIAAGVLEGTSNLMIMMVVVIATGLASVFAMETQRKTDPMIRASLNGTGELYFAKVLAGMSYILGSVIILLGTYYAYMYVRWGFDGMDSPVQIYLPFSQLPVTNGQLAGILVILVVLGSMFISAFALFVSNITRNALAAMAIIICTHLGLFALSTAVPVGLRTLSQGISLMPATLVSPRLVYEFRLVRLGRYLTCYQAAPIIYIAFSAILLVLGYVLYMRHEIKNN